ncbi:hypothetical protein [Crocinitomix catalasitica]|uniref:hypothetical protein n=1 Tax=Crocinitomix catalasitica TaxID=184607 RepID=UPI0004857790|nr:hypothetical protein [Crocinitomix catalasitica]
MATIKQVDKEKLSKKLLKFQKKGLVSYGKYLKVEQTNSVDKSKKKAYLKYINKEIERNKEKIEKINAKIERK